MVKRAGGTIFRVTAGGGGRHNRRFCTGIHYAVFASSARLSSAFCNEGREALLLLARGGRPGERGAGGPWEPPGAGPRGEQTTLSQLEGGKDGKGEGKKEKGTSPAAAAIAKTFLNLLYFFFIALLFTPYFP